jgi:glycosyltransferase involved in cell wall biosynthesis
MSIKHRIFGLIQKKRSPKYIFIGNNLEQTGAPFVLFDIIKEYADKFGPEKVEVWGLSIDEKNLETLNKLGIKYNHYKETLSYSWLDYELNINPDDFVLLNTVQADWKIRDRMFSYLEQGKLKKLHWYIHEDKPEIHFYESINKRIQKFLKKDQLKFYAVAKQVQQNYEKYFNHKVYLAPYKFNLSDEYKIKRKLSDYDEIEFIANGSSGDSRKGFMSMLFAFREFLREYHLGNESKYRNFVLKLIGPGDHFEAPQLKFIGEQLLKGHFEFTGRQTRAQVLGKLKAANANVTYSVMEALPLSIMESMFMGHFLLRNSCSGLEEQLVEEKNGFLLPDQDIQGFVKIIEQVLNKEKTSNQKLLEMGRKSQEIVAKYKEISYLDYFKAPCTLI